MLSPHVSRFHAFTGSAPRVEPFGPQGGFTVVYHQCDGATLEQIRLYQGAVRAQSPEWVTRLDFDGSAQTCRLHVFPLTALPYAHFWKPNRYGA